MELFRNAVIEMFFKGQRPGPILGDMKNLGAKCYFVQWTIGEGTLKNSHWMTGRDLANFGSKVQRQSWIWVEFARMGTDFFSM